MSLKKLPSNIDLKTLIEALKDETPEIVEDSTDVVTFISIFSIQTGSNPISKKFLYKLYKGYSSNPIVQSSFTMILNRYFESNRLYFFIDKPALKVTPHLQRIVNTTSTAKSKTINHQKHFKNFMDRYEIKEGDYWLEGYILYSLYDSWTYQNRKQNPIKKNTFLQICEVFFEIKTINNTKYFQIDKSITKYLSDKYMESLRNGYKNYENGKKKKEKNIKK